MARSRRAALTGIQEREQVLGVDLWQVPWQDSARNTYALGTWSGPEAPRLPPVGVQAAAQALCAYRLLSTHSNRPQRIFEEDKNAVHEGKYMEVRPAQTQMFSDPIRDVTIVPLAIVISIPFLILIRPISSNPFRAVPPFCTLGLLVCPPREVGSGSALSRRTGRFTHPGVP